MGWVIAIIIVAIIAVFMDSTAGKVVVGAGVVALGLCLISWITGISFFITLAKVCAVIIVVVITGLILMTVFNKSS